PLWLLHGPAAPKAARAAWSALGARLIEVPATATGLDPAAMMATLGVLGLTRVLCEGGGQVAAALLAASLVDRLEVFGAGLTLGADGRPGLGALPIARLADAPRWHLTAAQTEGPDLWSSWERPFPPAPSR
ncbi:MAG: dihydrofolate reductase family protein, partial [Gemmobacter sp.]|nr:dihydrofolate reductase family protein [Gemmobacter sp.]